LPRLDRALSRQLAITAGRPDVAGGHLERAIERNSAIGAKPRVAKSTTLLESL
jgi:hypothetical protein